MKATREPRAERPKPAAEGGGETKGSQPNRRARRRASAAVTAAPSAAEDHLSPDEMAQLLTRWQDPGETEHHLVRHALGRCEHCDTTAGDVRRSTADFGHWNHSLALAESTAAPGLWRRLEALPFRQQLAAVAGDETYQTWGFCRLLQRLSGEAAARRPPEGGRAADLASLAVAVSYRLESTYDADWIEDQQARSYALLGEARRLMGELHAAGDAFEMARQALTAGTAYPSVEAEVVALEALLRRDQRRLVTAANLFDRVHHLHTDRRRAIADPEVIDPHLGGRALLHRAWCVYHLGQPEAAAAALERAEELLDDERAPGLGLALRHGRVWTALALRDFEAAAARLAPATVLVGQVGDEAVGLRLRRAAARVATAAGETCTAKKTLRETATAFAAIDQGIDCALALIELADLCLRTGDDDGLKPLVDETLLAFSSNEVQRAEMSALILLQQAIEGEQLTIGLAERLAVMIEKGRRPCLDWWSGWGAMLSLERIDDAKQSA
jgi:tetratricopeptide (TPR) repeat protein